MHSSTGALTGRVGEIPRAVPRVNLGPVSIDTYSEAELVDELISHAVHGKTTRQIATVNAQFYVLAEKEPRFRKCLRQAEYICADGMPIVWACQVFGGNSVARVAGVDLIERLCEKGAHKRLRIFLLGGRPEAAQRTGQVLCARYPGLEVAGVSCPPFGFEKSAETLDPVLEQIAQARPHILFVGLGAPKQELLIQNHIRGLNLPIAIGIGGSFEILCGMLQRAPKWMRRSGLEWAFRLGQEPGRLWKRYLVGNVEFLWLVAKWRLRLAAFTAQPRET